MRQRQIVGVAVHHHVALDNACTTAANACQYLAGALSATGDPELEWLIDYFKLGIRRVSVKRAESIERFEALKRDDPIRFGRCVNGLEPWPDETVGGFVARCTCHDKCLHRLGVDPGPNGVCQCEGVKAPCPAHS